MLARDLTMIVVDVDLRSCPSFLRAFTDPRLCRHVWEAHEEHGRARCRCGSLASWVNDPRLGAAA